MKRIKDALDMRPGSLYATFGSKSGLFREALDAYVAHSGDEFREIFDNAPSVVVGLQRYLQMLARCCMGHAQVPAQTCMLIKTLLEVSAEDAALLTKANAMLARLRC